MKFELVLNFDENSGFTVVMRMKAVDEEIAEINLKIYFFSF